MKITVGLGIKFLGKEHVTQALVNLTHQKTQIIVWIRKKEVFKRYKSLN